jgi:hypothetical protein
MFKVIALLALVAMTCQAQTYQEFYVINISGDTTVQLGGMVDGVTTGQYRNIRVDDTVEGFFTINSKISTDSVLIGNFSLRDSSGKDIQKHQAQSFYTDSPGIWKTYYPISDKRKLVWCFSSTYGTGGWFCTFTFTKTNTSTRIRTVFDKKNSEKKQNIVICNVLGRKVTCNLKMLKNSKIFIR